MKNLDKKELFMVGGLLISIATVLSLLFSAVPTNTNISEKIVGVSNGFLALSAPIYILCFVRCFRAGGHNNETEKKDETEKKEISDEE